MKSLCLWWILEGHRWSPESWTRATIVQKFILLTLLLAGGVRKSAPGKQDWVSFLFQMVLRRWCLIHHLLSMPSISYLSWTIVMSLGPGCTQIPNSWESFVSSSFNRSSGKRWRPRGCSRDVIKPSLRTQRSLLDEDPVEVLLFFFFFKVVVSNWNNYDRRNAWILHAGLYLFIDLFSSIIPHSGYCLREDQQVSACRWRERCDV